MILVNHRGIEVLSSATGAGGQAISDNFTKLADRFANLSTSNPTTSSDDAHGYDIGSRWYNTATSVEWICTDPTTSAAVWQAVGGSNSTASLVVTALDTPSANGTALLAAYTRAKAYTPFGNAKSATNRVTVFVSPGDYDLGSQSFSLDTQFVDIVGIGAVPDDTYIHSTIATGTTSTGTIVQTANDVRMSNFYAFLTWGGTPNYDATDCASYFPSTNLSSTVMFRVKLGGSSASCSRHAITYSGTFYWCEGGSNTWPGTGGGVLSGTWINCTAGLASFGGHVPSSALAGGTCSGTFLYCRGTVGCFGTCGTASGLFIACTGQQGSFGGDTDGTSSVCSIAGVPVASGTFIGCRCSSLFGFGGNGTASGVFISCTGGAGAFGGVDVSAGGYRAGFLGASGIFISCYASGADNSNRASFGGPGVGGLATGQFSSCYITTTPFGRGGTFALTDAATIAVQSPVADIFTVTLGGNRTLANPSNAFNGQELTFRIRQDATGSRTLTLDTKYRFGTTLASITLSTGANKTDYLTVRYNGTADTFDVVDFKAGY